MDNAPNNQILNNDQKSKNQAKNDAKKSAKLAKFKAKQSALANKTFVKKESKQSFTSTKDDLEIIEIPYGEMKDLNDISNQSYNPLVIENGWYNWWIKNRFFEPQQNNNNECFIIPIPPPNITGSLHIGHALTIAIQDSLVRYNRMLGKTVLYNPGIDHAGISTQSIVEKQLLKDGITKQSLGREKFLEKVWEWKTLYGNKITEQLKRLGGSFDWTREKFTLDSDLSNSVKHAFCKLFEEKIIFRDNRLVNWCVYLNTSLSNLEVENIEIEGRTLINVPGYGQKEADKIEFGVLHYFKYPIEDSENDFIVVATTRIETMLGDSAVAVHPDDQRYNKYKNRYCLNPINNKRVPIIFDAESVDLSFGSGAVKITPAHDFNDFIVGKKHNLEFVNLMNDNGTFNKNGYPYEGVKRFEVRKLVIDELKKRNLYVKSEPNKMTLPICAKSKDIIEPIMKPQWWVNSKELVQPAIEAVKNNSLIIMPKTSENQWYSWLNNIQPWCISRQLWWGHRIPAYYVKTSSNKNFKNDCNIDYWVCGVNEEDAMKNARAKFPNEESITLEQDEDVLDTWFSSGLWPFSIHGWPEKTPDLERFYPATLLETGWDILFFWVARMVMLGIKLTGQLPFKEVYCHSMVRDAHGRKMSKSLGNVVDPIDVIEGIKLEKLHFKLENGNLDKREIKKAKEGQKKDYPKGIPQCGTDALRFALCAYSSSGRDINLDILRVEGYRKFCNKIWNAAKLCLKKLENHNYIDTQSPLTGNESIAQHWIINKLNCAITETRKGLDQRNFMNATTAVHGFWLYNFCDVYLEVIKHVKEVELQSYNQTLFIVFEAALKLLHPFMPYITEELYQRLKKQMKIENLYPPSISISKFPDVLSNQLAETEAQAQMFETINKIVSSSRKIQIQYNIQKNTKFIMVFNDKIQSKELESYKANIHLIKGLIKGCAEFTIINKSELASLDETFNDYIKDTSSDIHHIDNIELYLKAKGQINIDIEKSKLQQKIVQKEKDLIENIKNLNTNDSTNEYLSTKQKNEQEISILKETMQQLMNLQ